MKIFLFWHLVHVYVVWCKSQTFSSYRGRNFRLKLTWFFFWIAGYNTIHADLVLNYVTVFSLWLTFAFKKNKPTKSYMFLIWTNWSYCNIVFQCVSILETLEQWMNFAKCLWMIILPFNTSILATTFLYRTQKNLNRSRKN